MGVPPALRYLWYLAYRSVMFKAYEAHKTIVLWRECDPPAIRCHQIAACNA